MFSNGTLCSQSVMKQFEASFSSFLTSGKGGLGSTKFVAFETLAWHNECFFCHICKDSMVGKGFIQVRKKKKKMSRRTFVKKDWYPPLPKDFSIINLQEYALPALSCCCSSQKIWICKTDCPQTWRIFYLIKNHCDDYDDEDHAAWAGNTKSRGP